MNTEINHRQSIEVKKEIKSKTHRVKNNSKDKKGAEVLFQRMGAKIYAITILAGEPYWSEVSA